MIPKQPPKRTQTQPGLGIDDVLKRLDSAELQKVRDSFEHGEATESAASPPPPSARARLPREEEDSAPDSAPRSDRFQVGVAGSRPPHPATRPRPAGSPPIARQQTAVGLGSKTRPQAHAQQLPDSGSGPASRPGATPASRPGVGRLPTGNWAEEAPSGPRSRKPLTVDQVGDTATRIARTTRPQTAPKLIATQAHIASAPIDSRTAFVLSLVDGTTDVPAIVDATGMPADEVIGILARLARLGLISVP